MSVGAVLIDLAVVEQVFSKGRGILIGLCDAFVAEVSTPVKGASACIALFVEVADVA